MWDTSDTIWSSLVCNHQDLNLMPRQPHLDPWPVPSQVSEKYREAWLRGEEHVLAADGADDEAVFLGALVQLRSGRREAAAAKLRFVADGVGPWSMGARVELAFLEARSCSRRSALVADLHGLGLTELPMFDARRLHALGYLAMLDHQFEQALTDLSAAEAGYAAANAHAGMGQVCDTLSATFALLGHSDAALRAATRAIACKALVGDVHGLAISLGSVGRLALSAGRATEAVWYFERNLAICSNAQDQSTATLWLARALLEAGEIEGALTLTDRCLESPADADAYADQRAFLRINRALALAALGQNDQARASLQPLASDLVLAKHTVLWYELTVATLDIGESATVALREVVNHAQELGIAEVRARGLIELSRRSKQLGERRDQLLLAHRIASEHGYGGLRECVEAELLRLDCPPLIEQEPQQPIGTTASSLPTQYVIRGRLGGGTFGDVLRAYDLRRHKEVAIKMLRVNDQMDGQLIRRRMDSARLEFEATQRLHHPGIVRVLSLGCTLSGQPFVVQDWVPGRSLRSMLPWADTRVRAIRVLAQVSQTLAALHEAGVLHLDLKPDNIMIKPDGRAVLIDFGIAALCSAGSSGESASAGTRSYAAPEQRGRHLVDQRTDLYAFGVTLHEVLSGHPPREHEASVVGRVLDVFGMDVGDSSARVDSSIDGSLRDVIARAIHPNPARRQRTATVLCGELETIAAEAMPIPGQT